MIAQPVCLGFVGAGYMGPLAHIQNYWKLQGVELVAPLCYASMKKLSEK